VFIKEDVDLPERSGRKRSASGLPPGATNYITARGAKRTLPRAARNVCVTNCKSSAQQTRTASKSPNRNKFWHRSTLSILRI